MIMSKGGGIIYGIGEKPRHFTDQLKPKSKKSPESQKDSES